MSEYDCLRAYRELGKYFDLHEEGCSEGEIEEAEKRLKCRFPEAFRDFYKAFGKQEQVTGFHHVIYPLDKLYFCDGFLVFAEENQGVVIWGLVPGESSRPVVQGVQPVESYGWHAEDDSFCGFVLEMLCWSYGDEGAAAEILSRCRL